MDHIPLPITVQMKTIYLFGVLCCRVAMLENSVYNREYDGVYDRYPLSKVIQINAIEVHITVVRLWFKGNLDCNL